MEQHRVAGSGRAGLIPGDMGTQGHYRRSWINPLKIRLSRQTWVILLVMVLIMVAWKSRSVPAKAVNYSKNRQEIPAPLEVKYTKDEVDEHVFEGTTMENELSSDDSSDMELLPTIEDHRNILSGIGVSSSDDDTFSTPTTYDINEDMLSSKDSKGKGGEDTLFKQDMNSEASDDDTYSTPLAFDADPFSEDMLSSKDSIRKDGENTSDDVKYSTPTEFDIKSTIEDMRISEESKKEDEVDEPSQKAQENGDKDYKREGDEDAPSQQVKKTSEEVIVSEDPKEEDKVDKPSQKVLENGDKDMPNSNDSEIEGDIKAPSQQVKENGEEFMASEEPKEEKKEDESSQQVQKNGDKDVPNSDNSKKEGDIKKPSQQVQEKGEEAMASVESTIEDEETAPPQQAKVNDEESKEYKGEDLEVVLPQQLTENDVEELTGKDSKGEKEEDATSQKAPQNGEEIEPMAQSVESSTACSPHHHIMFLKTHKCASSTVQNILLRYGYQHDLYFALSAGHYLGHPKKFKYHMMNRELLPASGKADILTLHSRLNIPEHQKAMYPDAKWITIVRDPVEQFESLYNYYELNNFYEMDLASFLNQSVEVLRKAPRWESKHGRNTMLFDMGYQDTLSQEALPEVIKTMDNLFHYVMIAEKMDESLILLRNELCWTNHDIIGFTKNARIKENKTLSIELADKINQMNIEDTAIYNHFLNKHIQSVEKYGIDKMAEEVSELQKLRAEYYDFCVAEEVLGHDKRLKGNKEFKGSANAYLPSNSNGTCSQIIMKETSFVQLVRKHQMDLINSHEIIKK